MVKRLPAMRETWVRFLGREDPLEKEMAIHSSILAWKIPWMEEPDRLQSMGSQRVGHDFTFTFKHPKGCNYFFTYFVFISLSRLNCRMCLSCCLTSPVPSRVPGTPEAQGYRGTCVQRSRLRHEWNGSEWRPALMQSL